MKEIIEKAKAIEKRIIEDRRALHGIPEVGVYTPKTAAYVKKRLAEMDIERARVNRCGWRHWQRRAVYFAAGRHGRPAHT